MYIDPRQINTRTPPTPMITPALDSTFLVSSKNSTTSKPRRIWFLLIFLNPTRGCVKLRVDNAVWCMATEIFRARRLISWRWGWILDIAMVCRKCAFRCDGSIGSFTRRNAYREAERIQGSALVSRNSNISRIYETAVLAHLLLFCVGYAQQAKSRVAHGKLQ